MWVSRKIYKYINNFLWFFALFYFVPSHEVNKFFFWLINPIIYMWIPDIVGQHPHPRHSSGYTMLGHRQPGYKTLLSVITWTFTFVFLWEQHVWIRTFLYSWGFYATLSTTTVVKIRGIFSRNLSSLGKNTIWIVFVLFFRTVV